MRKLSLFSLAGLAALGLVAAPAQSGTIIQNDLPDFVVMDGDTSGVDLADFFASPTAELSYTVDAGGSVDGSMATVFAADGEFTASASDGEDTVSSTGQVMVSDFLVTGLDVDDNNRIVGMDGGNLFLNGIVPGETVSSAMPLGLPEGGGSGTPGGGTPGAAALIATLSSVELSYSETGLRVREAAEATTGTAGEVAGGGLTATLNADGSYSLAADDTFAGAHIVTFGADTGDSADAVHLVAAQSTAAAVSDSAAFTAIQASNAEGQIPGADVSFGDDGITITADDGEAILLIHNGGVPIADGMATISVDYESSATEGVFIASLGFTGNVLAGTPGNLFFTNTNQLGSGNISTVISGSEVYPGCQVFNGSGSTVTVTISGLEIIQAGPIMDYTLNPNATAPLAADGSVAALAEWNSGIIGGQVVGAPVLSEDNNFNTPSSAGSLLLETAGDLNLGQAFTSATLGAGSFVAEAWVMGSEGNFTLHITDGAMASQGNWAGGAEGWHKVVAAGSNSNEGATFFVVAQGAGGTFTVDDVAVRVVDENEGDFVDMALLGL